ncbi:MAG: hypothetical protein KAG82_02785 [Alcanivoracaceae bacterium]|nr:hypothetical protein [Alcanivoracaceae bacterium]
MRLTRIAATCLVAATGSVWAETLEDRLAAAESRLASLEQQNSVTERITVNGFIRFAMETQTSIKDAAGNELSYRDALAPDTWDNKRLSRAGLQLNAHISDEAEAVVQLLARGSEDFAAEAQWAYLAYNVRPDVTVRAGRLVLPFYLHSQYLNVGYAYPWVELPTEIYGAIPIDTMEGIDATWNINTGSINHKLNVFWGSMEVDVDGTVFEIDHQHGVNLRSSLGNWTSWLSYTSSLVTLDLSAVLVPPLAPYSLDRAYAHYTGAGLQYDNGSLVLMAEVTELKISAPANWFPTQPAGYVMAGYRFGKLMPHITWAYVDAEDSSDVVDPVARAALYDTYADRQKSWTLGARYELTTGIALKAEASRYYDFSNDKVSTQGVFSGPTGSGAPDESNPLVFRLAVDAVF